MPLRLYNKHMSDHAVSPTFRTVLFVDLVGSTSLYERVGDSEAYRLVDRSIKELQKAIESKTGRIVKHTGDGLMAVFDSVDAAASAALAMNLALRDSPGPASQRLSARVGFNFGSVIESSTDVFGETVNFAARLAELASSGRALITSETRDQLSPHWRSQLNTLPPRVLRGASRPVELFELKCDSMGDTTVLRSTPFEIDDVLTQEMQLRLGDQLVVIDSLRPLIRLGRSTEADLIVRDNLVSRKHAELELRGDKFVLIDRSSNGSYVRLVGEKEFMLNREEAVLRGQGAISLGRSNDDNPLSITFVCS